MSVQMGDAMVDLCHSRYNGLYREAVVHAKGVVVLIIEPKSNAATYVDTFQLGNPRYLMQGNGGDVAGTLTDRNIMASSL
jgi:hypothetical protein